MKEPYIEKSLNPELQLRARMQGSSNGVWKEDYCMLGSMVLYLGSVALTIRMKITFS